MRYHLITLGLAPLLLLQGRKVRRDTPLLPEPEGEREGSAGQGRDLRLLILGDSAAAGVGAAHQGEALSGRLVEALGEDYRVHWRLSAATGHRTRDLLARLAATEAQAFDVVVISVGVNDATGGTGREAWLTELAQLLDAIRERHSAGLVVFSGLPPMHLFPALPQPLRWYMGLRARRLNETLAAFAARHPDCAVAVPDFPLDTACLASDGFHPGPLAYAEWARHLAALIRRRQKRE
ncbi:MAG: hydrolase family protein [Moraxellaceae bacterium]|jgi:lysophospholipase L1-like esterase|nr:hydrolase family protein [Moraxellaceae bacterium]